MPNTHNRVLLAKHTSFQRTAYWLCKSYWKNIWFHAIEYVTSGTYWAAPSLRRLSLLSSNRTSERRYLQHISTVRSETCFSHITNVNRLYKTKNQTTPYPQRLLGRKFIASYFIILTEQNENNSIEMDLFQDNLANRYKLYSTGCRNLSI